MASDIDAVELIRLFGPRLPKVKDTRTPNLGLVRRI